MHGGTRKKVRFLEEGLEYAKREGGFGFTIDYFMLKVDKFFGKESNVVLLETDNQYKNYLDDQKKEQEELEHTINDLDDFFLF